MNHLQMIDIDFIRKMALSFPETSEAPHFEKISFRVKKKIFATFDAKTNRATIKLSLVDQDVFTSIDKNSFKPVDNKWGLMGWTVVELSIVSIDIFQDAMTSAYCETAPKTLAKQVQNQPIESKRIT
ncbi:MAG: MmcQ/YjbR family DNA-binding protein [Saprospiraceae bacterium]